MSKFQIILLSIFGVCIVGGVLVFSLSRGSGSTRATVQVWGPFSAGQFQDFLNQSGLANSSAAVGFTYVEKAPATLDADFTEALAEGRGPDLVILDQSELWQERQKLSTIPAQSVKLSDFTNAFIDESSLLINSQGVYALPLVIDPLVLYSNKDLLNAASLAVPPAYWDQIYDYSNKLTARDGAGNITQSTIALGEVQNIPHAKDIVSMLFLQAGTPITAPDINTGLSTVLANSFNQAVPPGQSALDFYTQFANPDKPFYGWNRSLQPADTNFVSGDSALYMGYASELPLLRAKNPNLNLGVSSVPQSRVSSKSLTLGRLYAVAIVRNSPNQAAGLTAALTLAGSANVHALSLATGLPPARRDLLAAPPTDSTGSIFYTAALQSAGWLDPNPGKTQGVFADMINSVTSGRALVGEALATADASLDAIIRSE